MEQVKWNVSGMDCASCAASITKSLQRQGLQQIKVNHISGEVSFESPSVSDLVEKAASDVESLGYKVEIDNEAAGNINKLSDQKPGINKHILRFLICLPFTLLLMAHMWLPFHWLHQPFIQLALAIPVYIIGMQYFGVSAWRNLRKANFHMNVLIALGASAAFFYSVYGLLTPDPGRFLFFETAASIITIVFFGNWLEHVSIASTQKKIRDLTQTHPVMANMIAYDDQHNEQIFPIENKDLRVGDLVLIKSGEEVPMDCKILSGEVEANESIITGESIPVFKKQGDILIGGSVIANGNAKCYVTATGKETVRSGIMQLMHDAQTHKPPIQQLADKISSIFVPFVLGISLLTVLLNLSAGHQTFTESLMRGIAVLVVACPCAMGLATPAALAVGIGRAAANGILFTQPRSMELFKTIRQVVFDKTGTLTTGKFRISDFGYENVSEAEFKSIVFALEKMSNHPIAKSISKAWNNALPVRLKQVTELKGLGMRGTDASGNLYTVGSEKLVPGNEGASHHLYVQKNEQLIGWIDIADELRSESAEVVAFFRSRGIKTILLSGDTSARCKVVADTLGLDEMQAGQSPAQKLEFVKELCATAPTLMIGDGINDAPALARATVSISVSQAAHLAVQSASVVLTDGGIGKVPRAFKLGRATFGTIRTNLLWAFAYNIVAIPVAAFGYLHPAFGALLMGGSDIVLALNSLLLGIKKI